jgi:hypothetical protein
VGKHATGATDNVFGEDMERVDEPADVDEMHSLHEATSVVVIEIVEPQCVPMTNQPTDQSTQKGKAPVEATEAIRAWQDEDSAPEIVPYKVKKGATPAKKAAPAKPPETKVETRSWAETFTIIGKYGVVAALAATVVLMFLNDHLPHHHPARHVAQGHEADLGPLMNDFAPSPAIALPPSTQVPGGEPHVGSMPVPQTVAGSAPEAAPPPVTVTETEPPPAPKPPPAQANVTPHTIHELHRLLHSHGLYTNESSQQLQETGQGICERAAAGSSSADIDATQQQDNIPRAAAGQMVLDVIDSFCPQYG